MELLYLLEETQTRTSSQRDYSVLRAWHCLPKTLWVSSRRKAKPQHALQQTVPVRWVPDGASGCGLLHLSWMRIKMAAQLVGALSIGCHADFHEPCRPWQLPQRKVWERLLAEEEISRYEDKILKMNLTHRNLKTKK